MKPRTPANARQLLESLEPRTLLSTNILENGALSFPLPRISAVVLPTPIGSGTGVTLNLTVGTPFSGQVAFYPSPVLDPPYAYSATINWGDGVASKGTLQYAVQNNVGGYAISGNHTYNAAGTFTITTTVIIGPINGALFPSRIAAIILSKAIVTGNSGNGVTINEIAGQSFTADLGSFTTIAPAINLPRMINWGDGSSSTGTLKATGVIGIDVLKFDVYGTHTYAASATYPIHIVVIQPPIGPVTTPTRVIATIDSTAIVTASNGISLAGTITGTYTVSGLTVIPLAAPALTTIVPFPPPDIGRTYSFQGTGTAGELGNASASGKVTLPGFIMTGHATGALTLTNANGSVTLQLTGPAEPGFGSFPSTLSYTIIQATGSYVGDTASGTIAVTLTPSATASGANVFTFVIN